MGHLETISKNNLRDDYAESNAFILPFIFLVVILIIDFKVVLTFVLVPTRYEVQYRDFFRFLKICNQRERIITVRSYRRLQLHSTLQFLRFTEYRKKTHSLSLFKIVTIGSIQYLVFKDILIYMYYPRNDFKQNSNKNNSSSKTYSEKYLPCSLDLIRSSI